ncbi:TIGR03773 family transporter-associated surface protein [Kribbella sp. NPDC051770]|uniref:TIGR03773 family transporter-associated surface protein n=1 Tax=Kribbella sp. NPDC051770 TaxID=3155413 RepID=UPI00341F3FA9
MTATHLFRRWVPAAGLALLTCLILLIPRYASAADAPPEVLRAVHTDVLHTTYDGARLQLRTRIGNGDYREADPAGLVFNLEDRGTARVEPPDLPAFGFLGSPGAPVWIAPESQDPELLWPGWDTETIPAGALAGDAVDLTLVSAAGPGAVEVFFNYDEFAGSVPRLFSSADPAYRTVRQPVGRHVHANWAFTQLGTYSLVFEATARTPDGRALTSGPVTYTFAVGGYEPPTVTPPTSPPTTAPTTPTPPPTSPPTTPTSPTRPPTSPTAPPTSSPSSPPVTRPASPSASRPATPPSSHPTLPPNSPSVPAGLPTTPPSSSPPAPERPVPVAKSSALRPCVTTTSHTAGSTTSPGPDTTGSSSPGATNSPDPTTNPTPTRPPSGGPSVKLTTGHADFAVRVEGNGLRSRVKDGTRGPVVWRAPEDVLVELGTAAEATAPGGAFGFLGPAGSKLWQIPQTQKDGVVWLGWNTEELTATQVSGGSVNWRLDKVTGPGRVAVFEFDSFGQPKIVFNSADGLPDTVKVPLGTHAHGNWTFTQPGTYQLTFTHTATLATGTAGKSTSTLTFKVGPQQQGGGAPANQLPGSGASANQLPGGGAPGNQLPTSGNSPKQLPASGSSANQLSAPLTSPLTRDAVKPSAPSCSLATTGADATFGWIVGGAVLLVVGTVLLVATRRRRQATQEPKA